uniref:ABC-2 type transporter transmembrane domain-containing protein n=1 Tax=Craspedostauros australis TaxID=1486917 RepID=A0A7R9ZID9_9STRA|mmetsp:Transcript_12191/g.33557  ORF Transcript_12191/g.33557 Transcript_12191/m.33557 type:complete len:383 (+) Transcript_12191:401-1549(+)
MIMSRGRQAFSGDVNEATPCFDRIGFPLPEATNPADHFLDLVNSDFSGDEEAEHMLNLWDQHKSKNALFHRGSTHDTELIDNDADDDEAAGVGKTQGTSFMTEISITFKRHLLLIGRNPILYLGRCLIFLMMSTVISFVFWNAQDNEFDQLYNKMWVQLWFVSISTNMGIVAVYALNNEFKSIQQESQNGMVSAATYVMVKSILVVPIFILFAIFSLLIPAYAIHGLPWEAFGTHLILCAAIMFVFESAAEALSVLVDDPIIGMMQFMIFWSGSFLFSGFLVPESDQYWPLKFFHYIMPYGYYIRSTIYTILQDTDFDDSLTSEEALEKLHRVFPVVENKDNVVQDIAIMLAIGAFYKILYIVAVMIKTRKVGEVQAPNQSP